MGRISSRKSKKWGLLAVIMLLAAGFRLIGVNWDQGNHLHPDERFLTMVGNAMKMPSSINQYLDPNDSSFNPENIGYKFFVYGIWPLTLNKLIAVSLNTDTYEAFTLQGRELSAFFDLVTVLLVFAAAKKLVRTYRLPDNFPYWAAFGYAVMVLPIQLAHFFGVDTFLTTFIMATILASLIFGLEQKWWQAVFIGLMGGLALATKVNAALVLPLVIGLMALRINRQNYRKVALGYLILVIMGYLTLRLADPYMFASENWLNLKLNHDFIENLKSLKSYEGSQTWYPPAIQWITKLPILYSLKNMTLLGVGLIPMVLGIVGIGISIRLIIKNRGRFFWVLILGWTLMIFLYQSTQFVKALRYFIYLYPMIAIWVGLGASYLAAKKKFISPILIGLMLIWPLMFISIYFKPHARVQASAWIIKNIPENSLLLSELWDDGLPVSVPNTVPKFYRGEQLPVFDQDTPEKWQKMNQLLGAGDYYLLTSNRGWGSIPTVPGKYPIMSQFYRELLMGKLPYQKIAEFTAYPSLKYLGIPLTLPDDWADETFTVYDHPKVMIYKLKADSAFVKN